MVRLETHYFFASKGSEVYAIDSSKIAIEYLTAKTKEINLDINFKNINAVERLHFLDNYFDAMYSQMFITWVLLMMN